MLKFLNYLNFFKFLNWTNLFSKIFGAFDPTGDSKILKDEESHGVRYALVIKKSVWYSILNSWDIILNLLLLFLNVYFLYKQNLGIITNNVLSIVLTFNIFYGAFSYFVYLFHFIRLNRKVPKVDSIYKWIQRSELGDKYHKNFFNQSITNIFIYGIVFIYIFVFIFINGEIKSTTWAIANFVILIIQIYLLIRIKNRINNQEMDFIIITPDKFYLYDQISYINNNNNDFPISKIKNVQGTLGNNLTTGSFVGSIFKFGTLKFLLDGDSSSSANNAPTFNYTPQINITKNQVALFTDKKTKENGEQEVKYKQVINTIPVFLTKILYDLSINIDKNLDNVINEGKFQNEIKDYLIKNKDKIRIEYTNGNDEIKKEIKSIGITYLNN